MKIHFTKKEYRLLVDMLCIADWVLHSHDLVDKPEHIEHHDLYQKLLSFYKEMGAEDIIENDDSTYYETRPYEEELMEKFIKPYNGETFWEELVDRLAMRELSKTVGFERFQEMDIEEQGFLLHKRRNLSFILLFVKINTHVESSERSFILNIYIN